MATEAQQRMLWAIANAHGLTKPTNEQTAEMSTAKVGEVRTALEKGVDVFKTANNATDGPRMNYSTKDADLLAVLARLTSVLERLEAKL